MLTSHGLLLGPTFIGTSISRTWQTANVIWSMLKGALPLLSSALEAPNGLPTHTACGGRAACNSLGGSTASKKHLAAVARRDGTRHVIPGCSCTQWGTRSDNTDTLAVNTPVVGLAAVPVCPSRSQTS